MRALKGDTIPEPKNSSFVGNRSLIATMDTIYSILYGAVEPLTEEDEK